MAKKKVTTTVTTTVTEEVITTKPREVDLVVLGDCSGSMSSIMADALGGTNTFIEGQKNDPEPTFLTFITFDDRVNVIYDQKPIKEVSAITSAQWFPRGNTALYDAMGHVFTKFRNSDRKVIVYISTDGYENASREYNQAAIQQLTKEFEAKGWSFIYQAADQNAILAATNLGITTNSANNVVRSSTRQDLYASAAVGATHSYVSSLKSGNIDYASRNSLSDDEGKI